MKRSRLRAALVVTATLALLAAGCGDDDDDGAAGNGDADTIVVRAVDFDFEDLPDTVSVGTQLELVNESDEEVHELVAVRILDDVDFSVEELLDLPEEEADEYLAPGPPAMVIVAAPGEDGEVVVGDGTFTEPGRYAVLCFIPTGVDADEYFAAAEESEEGPPEFEDAGPPHIVHGMFAELLVE